MARQQRFDGGKARELRERKGLEITELVELIGPNPKTGKPWDRSTVTNAELGYTQPGLRLCHAWARALNVSWDALMTDAPASDGVDVELVTRQTP
jgi:transcriptional regulator with XRE-family HTH domain